MFGAILGDIIGSPYEFDMGDKVKTFPLFSKTSAFTDDSVMTIAVAEALMAAYPEDDDSIIRERMIVSLRKWGNRYPDAGYGLRFIRWLVQENPMPYNSYGNGSAMRVSAAAWLFEDIETVQRMARLSADISHNHPEGIKGASAIATAIFMARKGADKAEIKACMEKDFGYHLNRTCDEIRPNYRHVESCMETVPEAITAFLEGESFEDVIRTAVSLGGDADTLTAIAGSIAEGFYGVPEELKKECRARLTEDLREVLDIFSERITM